MCEDQMACKKRKEEEKERRGREKKSFLGSGLGRRRRRGWQTIKACLSLISAEEGDTKANG